MFWLDIEITYSSTCPQSHALAMEVFKNRHITNKTDNEILNSLKSLQNFPATPHAQRSLLNVSILFESNKISKNKNKSLDLILNYWIESIEQVLKTSVQTAVKKTDEMQFAVLNAENSMFCEDAVRKVAHMLKNQSHHFDQVLGFLVQTSHLESLHPHDATAQIQYNYKPFEVVI